MLGFVGKKSLSEIVFRFPCCEGRFLKWTLVRLISKAHKDPYKLRCY